MVEFKNISGTEKDIQYVESKGETLQNDPEVYEVQRNLKARHISMIALGGTIATGLFISTKGPISAGPVLALISYLWIATLAWSVTQSLGEMATYIPVSGSATQFPVRFISQAVGCANGWMYWFSWTMTFALEISIIGQIVQYWTDAVPLAAWISIFWVLVSAANMFPVRFYGEVEFWVSSIKVIAVFGWLIYALCMVCGAGKTGPIGFRYWRNPGPWGDGSQYIKYVPNIHTARFLSWLNTLVSAMFTYQGVELIGVSCGECANPRKTVPSAIRKVIWRIVVFFIFSIFFMGLLIPYNDPRLNNEDSFASASPFIVAIQNSGTPILPDIFNAVILLAVISAANSNIYIGSRTVYGLAQSGVAPKIFLKTTNKGVPWFSVAFTAAFGALGYMVLSNSGETVFNWLLNITAVASMITWATISFAHIRFMNVLKSRDMSRDLLPFKAAWMPWSAYYCFGITFVLIFVQGFSAFYGLSASSFFTAYISLILFVVIWIVAHFYFNGLNRAAFTKAAWLTPLDEIDIDTGRREVDEETWEEKVPTGIIDRFWNIIS